ncbi:MAG: hypothetical protein COA33_010445 [Fluviicola sp.]|nr:hypothetical protein [Fluviicola sp.]
MSEDTEEEKRDIAIVKMRDYAEEQYDKLLVYLNSGALVLTVGFVKDIVEITDETNTTLLKISWICFTASLLVILISHRTGIIATNFDIKGAEKISNVWNNFTKFLNWLAMMTLAFGIITFLIFVSKTI